MSLHEFNRLVGNAILDKSGIVRDRIITGDPAIYDGYDFTEEELEILLEISSPTIEEFTQAALAILYKIDASNTS